MTSSLLISFVVANWPNFLIGFMGAILGALMSSALSFGVQHLLDRKRQREAERQAVFLSYVGVARICLGVESFFRLMRARLPDFKLSDLADPPDGAYGPIEFFCAFIAYAYKVNPQGMAGLPQKFAREEVENAFRNLASNIGAAEDLGKIPRKVLMSYLMLQAAVTNLQVRYKMLLSAIKQNDPSEMKASLFHAVPLAVSDLVDRAREVRSEFIGAKLVDLKDVKVVEERLRNEVDQAAAKMDRARSRLAEATKITDAMLFFRAAPERLREIAPNMPLGKLNAEAFNALEPSVQRDLVSKLIAWMKEAIIHKHNLSGRTGGDQDFNDLEETLTQLEHVAAQLGDA